MVFVFEGGAGGGTDSATITTNGNPVVVDSDTDNQWPNHQFTHSWENLTINGGDESFEFHHSLDANAGQC